MLVVPKVSPLLVKTESALWSKDKKRTVEKRQAAHCGAKTESTLWSNNRKCTVEKRQAAHYGATTAHIKSGPRVTALH